MKTGDRGLRAIALFETAKGLLALLTLLAVLNLLHRDLHALAVQWIATLGIDPQAHLAAVLLDYADSLPHIDTQLLTGGAFAYASVRFVEAWGLWRTRRWAEYLGAGSGGIYVPFELLEFAHKPSWLTALVLLVNLGIVAYLVWHLWHVRRRARPEPDA